MKAKTEALLWVSISITGGSYVLQPCPDSRAYLENVLGALANEQVQQSEFLVRHALDLLEHIVPVSSALSPLPVHFSYDIGLDTGITRAGRPNEDYAWACSCVVRNTPSQLPTSGGLFLVADGMGGHADGGIASRLAVHTLVDYVLPQLTHGLIPVEALPNLLVKGVQQANQAIYQQNIVRGVEVQEAMMGTTITVAISLGTTVHIANVGDSRAYLLRRGESLCQLTRDHSLVAHLVATGDLRPEDVYTHPQRNHIYRSLGTQEQVTVDTFCCQLQDHDILLLCSDGLWEMVREVKQIEEVLSCAQLSTQQVAERLIQLARRGGGHDNIGLVVVHAQVSDVQDVPTMLFAPLDQLPTRSTEPIGVQQVGRV